MRPEALYQYLADSGLHPASKVSGIERVEPPAHVRHRLGIAAPERLLHFTRPISVEDEPLDTAGAVACRGVAVSRVPHSCGITPV